MVEGAKENVEIEAVGGLGKTAAVLEFIRHLKNYPDDMNYNFVYLTAKSAEW